MLTEFERVSRSEDSTDDEKERRHPTVKRRRSPRRHDG